MSIDMSAEKGAEKKFARLAAIDIGTVTTRLLVADVFVQGSAVSSVQEIYRDMRIAQLGLGMNVCGQLSSKGIRSVLEALTEYVQLLQHFQVDDILCVATSAVRDAKNAEQLVGGAAKLDLDIEVIPGEIEAQLSFIGATYDDSCAHQASLSDPESSSVLDTKPTLVVDSGGGSTEFVLGSLNQKGSAEILKLDSLQVGARRITDMFINSDPPRSVQVKGIRSYLQKVCDFELKKYAGQFERLVAVAGTATTLAAVLGKIDPYNPNEIQGYRVSRTDLDVVLQLFLSKSLEQRQKIRGLEPKRAEVIVAGTLILEAVLDALNCEEFFTSDRDLLYGIILSATKSALV